MIKSMQMASLFLIALQANQLRRVTSVTLKNMSMKIDNRACFGAGCYWGTEKFFKKDFNKKFPASNIQGAVGFMGPPNAIKNPSCN